MTDPWDGVAWTRYVHAFGPATNIPHHLTEWLGSNPRKRLDSGTYLRNANFAFGVWPATAPTASVLAELLDGGGLDEDEIYLPLLFIDRIAHLCDLGTEAETIRGRCEQRSNEAATWTTAYAASDHAGREAMRADEPELMRLVHEAAQLACFTLIPRFVATVLPFLDDERIVRRGWIAATIAALARHPLMSGQRTVLAARVEQAAQAEMDVRELATLLIAFGDLGGVPRAWLDHPHVGVRGSAAMAETLVGDVTATNVLTELSREPGVYFASFGDVAPPAQFMVPPHGRDLLSEAFQGNPGACRARPSGRSRRSGR